MSIRIMMTHQVFILMRMRAIMKMNSISGAGVARALLVIYERTIGHPSILPVPPPAGDTMLMPTWKLISSVIR
jgi:hypothetical protein